MRWLCRAQSLLESLYRGSGVLAALCLVAMALCVVASIAARLLNLYIGGITEYSSYLMGASNCLGLAYAFRNNAHIRVTLVVERCPAHLRHLIESGCLLFASAAACYLAWYMAELSYMSWQFDEVSEGGDQLPLWMPQAVTAVGALMLAISVIHSTVEQLLEQWLGLRLPGHEPRQDDELSLAHGG